MIGRLNGVLLDKQPPLLWIEVQGLGYEVEAPMSTFYRLPARGEKLQLHTHLTVREDAHLLYGFYTQAEKDLFRALIKISGVGPKVALAILSGVSVDEFWVTVSSGDAAQLTRLPGIGKKTAERLLVEMRDKAGVASTIPDAGAEVGSPASALAEARSALVALGYKPAEAQKLTAGADEGDGAEQIIRSALKKAVRK